MNDIAATAASIDQPAATRRVARHVAHPGQIECVTIVFPRIEYVNRPHPATGLDGKFSVQYTTALALLDGEITVDSFTNERRFAPDATALHARVRMEYDTAIPPDFDAMHVLVKVVLKDGCAFEKRMEKLSGWCGIPLTREERQSKFYSCALRVLERPQADRLVELVDQLEHLTDITPIADIVRTCGV